VPSENLRALEKLTAAWNSGDLDSLLDTFDEYVVMVPVSNHPEPEPVHGREGVLEFSEQWLAPWDYYEFQTLDVVEEGDTIVWTSQQVGEQKETGITMDVVMHALLAFRHGRIVQVRWFWERDEAMRTAGLRE
jgi:ketosteroid isomerase-like protein